MKLKKVITQRMLENFEEALQNGPTVGKARYAGSALRSAIEAGWYEDVTETAGVDDMRPADVRAQADLIDDLYIKAISIDPN